MKAVIRKDAGGPGRLLGWAVTAPCAGPGPDSGL